MRRKMLKALSIALGAMVTSSAHAQAPDDVACEYGVVPYEPEPIYEPEPVPVYGIEEPVFLSGLVVNGVVRQLGTGTPLQGIQVSYGDMLLITAADGRFSFSLPALDKPDVELVFVAEDIDGQDFGGKHKSAKVKVQVVDGALSPLVAEQGLVLELKPR